MSNSNNNTTATIMDRQQAAAQNVKRMLRMAPNPEVKGGGFVPSDMARWMTIDSKTDYNPMEYEKYHGSKKVLVLCTEERYMTMENGNKFSTGNHPIQTMIPLMHFQQAGIDFDICTPRGISVKMEMWAMPEQDLYVQEFFKSNYTDFENPLSLADLVTTKLNDDDSPYIAVFIPGGHGAMLGLPENEDVAKLLTWIKDTDRFLIALSHGTAALLSLTNQNNNNNNNSLFPYKDYKICACPDAADKAGEKIGYTPGPMPWFLCEKLTLMGLKIMNRRPNANVQKDRKLITGASQKASNALGHLATDCLLQELRFLEGTVPEEKSLSSSSSSSPSAEQQQPADDPLL